MEINGEQIGEDGKEEQQDGNTEEFRCSPCSGAREVKAARTPYKPTRQEVEDHELTHYPYRNWCDPCVRGQAKDDPHRSVAVEEAHSSIPRVSMDYCFLTEDKKEDDGEVARYTLTVLVMVETLCRSLWAYAVGSKGASEDWVAEQIVDDIETIGLAEERVILKTDQENSITDLQRAVVKLRTGHGTAMEQSRVGDSNSNGRVERGIQDVKGLIRTMRSALETNIGEKIHLTDPIVPWMVRHAGLVITKCRIRENGRTAFQMMKGRRGTAKMVPFGETVLFKIPKTGQNPGSFEDRWEQGIWVGFVIRSGEHLVATKNGVFKVSTIMRRTSDKRWSAKLVKEMKGSPEEPIPGTKERRIIAFAKKYEDPNVEKIRFKPMMEAESEVRVAYIYKQDIEEHGATPGCPGCRAVIRGGRYRAKHSEECRTRFEELLSNTDQGKKIIEAAKDRMTKAIVRIGEDIMAEGNEAESENKRKKAKTNEKDDDMEQEPHEAKSTTSGGASGSGQTESQRAKSVDEQNQRELHKGIEESRTDHKAKKRRKKEGKEFTAMSPRGSKRATENEESEDDESEFGPHGKEMPMTPKSKGSDDDKIAVENDEAEMSDSTNEKVDESVGAIGEHPGPIDTSGDFAAGDMQWQDIGSGVFARTFPKMTKLITTTRGGPPLSEVHRRVVRSLTTGKVVDDCIVDETNDTVLNRRLRFPDDLRIELTMKGAIKMFERKGADVSELFSQPRIAQEAAIREYDGMKLVPGWSLDLTRTDPTTNKPWDLSKPEVRTRVRKLVKDTKPFVVIGSPPCTMFTSLQNLSKNRRDKAKFERKFEEAKQHIKFCEEVYKMQVKEGRFFMHEHPNSASSWNMPEMIRLAAMEGVEITTCDMCAYGLKTIDDEGEALAEKRTRIMSNAPEIIKRVSRQCTNKDMEKKTERHRHADLTNGRAKKCQVYPREFCKAVCEGIATQKKLYSLGMLAIPAMSLEEMMTVVPSEVATGNPSEDLHENEGQWRLNDGTVAFDDQSGAPLEPMKVAKARQEEIKYFKEMGVYEKVELSECWRATGRAPIAVRWIDINKGDATRPNYRSRLVAKEFKTDIRPDLYAATPPGECMRLMLSKLASGRHMRLMYADVSRAYFYAKAVRPVYVRLPQEDAQDGDEGKCGKLIMSMYGTRDAALNWSTEYTATLKEDGYLQGQASSCLFRHPNTGVVIMVHGDDFVAVGTRSSLEETKQTLQNKYKLKIEMLGDEEDCVHEVRILNKIVRRTTTGVEMEADPRHAELVIKDLGLANAKPSPVPGAKGQRKRADAESKTEHCEEIQVLYEDEVVSHEEPKSRKQRLNWQGQRNARTVLSAETPVEDGPILEMTDEDERLSEDKELDGGEATKYRAIAARLNYLSPDRVDIQYAVKEAARSMSAPRSSHWAMLTKIGRYLLKHPRMIIKFDWQGKQQTVTAYSDSDWAGCSKTARSTSGGILMIGKHVIKTYSRQQRVVALSSAEAELYALVAASAEALGMRALLRDLGEELDGEVYTDSSAALGITQRAGIGKVRHLRTQGLWVQETRISKRLAYKKVLGEKNPSDVLTKHVSGDLLEKHLETIGAERTGGRAESAPELNLLKSAVSLMEWTREGKEDHKQRRTVVRFARTVHFKAIPSENRGRRCCDRSIGRTVKRVEVTNCRKEMQARGRPVQSLKEGKTAGAEGRERKGSTALPARKAIRGAEGRERKGSPALPRDEENSRSRPSWADLSEEEDRELGRLEFWEVPV
ncbi:MAG: hypothetical protein CME32_20555 [Gimesia sp.]|nr:hypothetical protein [Gimesia sp.]